MRDYTQNFFLCKYPSKTIHFLLLAIVFEVCDNTNMLHKNTILYSWKSPEFEHQPKSKQWYWMFAGFALALVVLAIVLQNYLLAFFIVLGTFLVFTHASHETKDLEIEISLDGIRIEEKMHRYENLRAFWIKQRDENTAVLILLTSQNMTSLESIVIPNEIEPLELREFLLDHIEEIKLRESLTEKLMTFIRM